jgi:hypothetical protein
MEKEIITRGFSGRRSAADVKLPRGQYLTTDFPVLSTGPTPHVSSAGNSPSMTALVSCGGGTGSRFATCGRHFHGGSALRHATTKLLLKKA